MLTSVTTTISALLMAWTPMPQAQTSTTLAGLTAETPENPGSTAAGVVFFGVTTVIIAGAVILYLRNRRGPDTVR